MKYCPECASELSERTLEGVVRKVCDCPGCGFIHWDNPIPVVAGLVQHNNDIVLARNAKWPEGVFSLITGFLERHETPASAIARELKEELGLKCETQTFIGHYPFPAMNQLLIAYWVNASGTIAISDEISETKIVSMESLRSYDFSPLYLTTRIVNDWLRNSSTV